MDIEHNDLLDRALRLSESQRADLAGRLIESLDQPSDEEGIEAAWSDEIRDRLDQIDSGEVEAVPWEEAKRRIFDQVESA
jgi:putative addiction module component (TIGR02574 family)